MYTGMPFPGAENNYVCIGDVSEVFHVDVRILGDMIIIYREFGLDREDVAARDVLVYDWKRKIPFVVGSICRHFLSTLTYTPPENPQ